MRTALALALALLCPSLVFGQVSPRSTKDRRTAEEVQRLSDAECKAFVSRDVGALERLFSDDFIVTNPFNQVLHKQQVLEGLKSGRIVFESLDRKVDYAHVYGDTVVLAGTETGTPGGSMPGAGTPVTLRITAIWMKQRGSWREVARHASVVQASPAK